MWRCGSCGKVARDGGVRALQTLAKLGLRAAVAQGGASTRVCTSLGVGSIEERASGHGTGDLWVEIGDV
jgi:hypothetical protein